MNAIRTLVSINLIKTILFNFKVFPLKTAIHFPIVFYGRCQVVTGGKVELNVKPCFALLTIGRNQSLTFGERGSHTDVTYFRISGTLIINGYNNTFANGCKIYIKKSGCLCLQGNILIQNHSKVHCANSITIGEYSRISWESQIFDTNMHYLINPDGRISNNKGTVVIGNYCWIGNRCTIQKGTMLPDFSVVASNSLVNKDFTSQPHGVIAGTPARLISKGSKRLFDKKAERKLDSLFQQNPAMESVVLSDIIQK